MKLLVSLRKDQYAEYDKTLTEELRSQLIILRKVNCKHHKAQSRPTFI